MCSFLYIFVWINFNKCEFNSDGKASKESEVRRWIYKMIKCGIYVDLIFIYRVEIEFMWYIQASSSKKKKNKMKKENLKGK